MASNLINTRDDLDALAGMPEHDEAMAMLRGTLWRLERDDVAKAWQAVQDTSTIVRFGFSLADFPAAAPPTLPVYVQPTPEQIQQRIVTATQSRLDDFAKTRNYDSVLSACTYATSTVAKFATEGQYCVNARDATWSALYGVLAQVQAGTRPMPAGFADIESSLPALVWPA